MNNFKFLVLCIVLILSLHQTPIFAEGKQIEIGVEDKEKLGKYVPLDLKFTNSDGKVSSLREIIKRPTLISLVYFNCPGICSPLLNGLTEVIDKVAIEPGKDYDILSISFDHNENSVVATKWKEKYIGDLKRKIPADSWRFMTGDSASIKQLTNSLGFYFKKEGDKDYLHAATLIMLSPHGKITRYLFGTDFLPFDIKMSTIEASRELDRPTISKILDLCFKYDAQGRKYVLNLTRIVGTLMFLTIGIFATYLIKSGKKKRKSHFDQGDTI